MTLWEKGEEQRQWRTRLWHQVLLALATFAAALVAAAALIGKVQVPAILYKGF